MKYIPIALLALFSFQSTSAQNTNSESTRKSKQANGLKLSKHLLYADIGMSLAQGYPGFSATYNYRLARWFGIGVGVQGYFFFPTATSEHQFVPAVFGDLRFNIRPRKMSQFLVLIDVGADFYKHNDKYTIRNNKVYNVTDDNGVYVGFGLGYLRVLTKHGSGLYGSLKFITNDHAANAYNLTTQSERTERLSRGTAVVSIGYRF